MARFGRFAAAWFAAGIVAAASPAAVAASPALRVGVSETPPFSIRHADGSWRGITIDLWNAVAAQIERPAAFEARDLAGLLQGLQDRSLDVVAGPIAIRPDRGDVATFTSPYFATTLATAVRPPSSLTWRRVLGIVFSPRLLHVLLTMAAAIVTFGVLVWLFERQRNPDHFEKHAARGVWSAVWWAASTLTTVGYGDKTPRSVAGRLVAMLGMIIGILLASILTATFASEMTLSHLQGLVRGPEDLRRLTVGTVAGSAGERWLTAHSIQNRTYPDAAAALDALESGTVGAVVDLDAVLRYEAHTDLRDLQVQQVTLEPEFLAFALPRGSDLRDPIDRAVLRVVYSDAWTRLLQSYLGKP